MEKNRRCCDSVRCCTIATMDYGTDPISSFNHGYARAQNWFQTSLRGHNCVHFTYRLQCTVTINSNFAFLKTRNCLQLE